MSQSFKPGGNLADLPLPDYRKRRTSIIKCHICLGRGLVMVNTPEGWECDKCSDSPVLAPYLEDIKKAKRNRQAKQADGKQQCDLFNRQNKIGMPVYLELDDGECIETHLRSEAWQLGHGAPVAKVEGKTGGWCIFRIKPRSE